MGLIGDESPRAGLWQPRVISCRSDSESFIKQTNSSLPVLEDNVPINCVFLSYLEPTTKQFKHTDSQKTSEERIKTREEKMTKTFKKDALVSP